MNIDGVFLEYYFLVFARILPLSIFSPALGAQLIEGKTRMVIAVILAWIITPGIVSGPVQAFWFCLVLQLVIGCIMAVYSGITFFAIQSVGEWVDVHRGETLSSVLVPQLQSRSSSMGRMYLIMATVLFFSSGSHCFFIQQIAVGFRLIPAGATDPRGWMEQGGLPGMEMLVQSMAGLYLNVVKMGLPVVFSLWMTDIIMGFINRLAPAVQVFFLGLPLKMWLGMALAGLAVGCSISDVMDLIQQACILDETVLKF